MNMDTSMQPKKDQLALLTLLAGSFITTLDFFIVNVALPSMQHELHATPAAIQLIVAGYGLAFAAGLITAGRLGDLYGRRRIFMIGLGLFTLASAVAGFAPNVIALIVARVAQGTGAALLTPQVLALINTMFAGPKRTAAINAYGLSVGLGGVLGQVIGGCLVSANLEGLGWRSIFLINLPVGLIALLAAFRNLPETKAAPEQRAHERLDLVGMLLGITGVAAVVLSLTEGHAQGWPEWSFVSLGLSVPILTAFAWQQRRLNARGGDPLIHSELLHEKAFRVGLLLTLVFNITMGSFFFITTLFLQQGLSLSPVISGLMIMPLGIAFLFASIISAKLLDKFGRHTLSMGTIILALGYGLMAESAMLGFSYLWLLPGLIVAGTGMGIVLAPLQNLALANVLPRRAAAASGLLSTMQEIGGVLGIAGIGTIFFALSGNLSSTATLAHAFAESMGVIVVFVLVVTGLVRLMPRR